MKLVDARAKPEHDGEKNDEQKHVDGRDKPGHDEREKSGDVFHNFGGP